MPDATCHMSVSLDGFVVGSHKRIFDGVESFGFEPTKVLRSPLATHIRHRRAG